MTATIEDISTPGFDACAVAGRLLNESEFVRRSGGLAKVSRQCIKTVSIALNAYLKLRPCNQRDISRRVGEAFKPVFLATFREPLEKLDKDLAFSRDQKVKILAAMMVIVAKAADKELRRAIEESGDSNHRS